MSSSRSPQQPSILIAAEEGRPLFAVGRERRRQVPEPSLPSRNDTPLTATRASPLNSGRGLGAADEELARTGLVAGVAVARQAGCDDLAARVSGGC